MDAGEEDFVFFGTPIEREEDTSARKRKAVADAGQLRALPAWKQEVRDEEGRRRFHGAFTGGFSAGYYNTVGTKEGWTPQTFTSSRKNRAEMKKQSIYNFLDDEDIKDMGGQALETSMQFDTFGFTAAEFARKQAEKEQEMRPSAIPGPAPDEIILPASDSIGVKLLLKMGWRHGHSIKDKHVDSIYEARREARKALMAFSGNEDATEHTQKELSMIDSEKANEKLNDPFYASKSVPVFLLQPKQDLFGLGYDPYKHAPEFRDNKRRHESASKGSYKNNFTKQGSMLDPKSRKYAPGFGIGALEELDIEDEDIYTSGFEFEQTEVEDVEPSREINYNKKKIEEKRSTCLPGFKVASNADYQLERFHPPIVPADFKPHHKFPTDVETAVKIDGVPPPDVPPPEDNNLKVLINGFATLVARCGKVFEDLSKEKNKENPLFSFLTGGDGHEYYERKLWEEKQQNTTLLRMPGNFNSKPDRIMMAENRGKLLGEKPLQRSIKETSSPVPVKEFHFQSNLSDTFTKSDSLVQLLESAKPFEHDPAKQERFEQFLKDKYQGGLRRTEASSGNTLSEVDRARERLDFEAAAETIEKGVRKTDMVPPSTQQVFDIIGSRGQHFISPGGPEKHEDPQDEDNKANKFYLRREEFQWRPSPLLCKRFDILDPFIGKPPPLPRPKSRMDSVFFIPEPAKDLKIEGPDNVHRGSASNSKLEESGKQPNDHKEQETEEAKIDLQRPVDLYKAIFSDDSDDEEEASTTHVPEPIKKSEGANTTLNRLVAGDFLESLGKELGLEVPPDTNSKRHDSSTALMETIDTRDVPTENNGKSALMLQTILDNDHHKDFNRGLDRSKSASGDMVFSLKENKAEKIHQRNVGTGSGHRRSSSYPDSDSSGDRHRSGRSDHSRHRQSRSRTPESYSSDDKHQAKQGRSKSRHGRRRSEDTDSSRDSQEHGHSKSRSKKRTSHGTSERRSRRHKHRRVRSPSTHYSDDDTEDGRDDRVREKKSRDRGKHSVDSDSKRRKKHIRQD